MPNASTRTVPFESHHWNPASARPVPARRVTINISLEHVQEATWTRFRNPVSLALDPYLNEHACTDLFWNSDGFRPRYPEDDARIGIYQEVQNPETGAYDQEAEYYIPLPRRATRALWNLSREGIEAFRPINMAIDLPLTVLKNPSTPPSSQDTPQTPDESTTLQAP